MIAGVLFTVHNLVGNNKLLDLAVISYMSASATFNMQTFLKKEESLQMLLTKMWKPLMKPA